MVGSRFRYSRWDGTQKGFELDAFDVMGEMADDLLYHGDPMAALRRMMQDGFTDANGDRVQGLRELMERIRAERQARLENSDLGGVYSEINEELVDLINTERQALSDRGALAEMELGDPDATDSDKRNAQLAADTTQNKGLQLDLMPDDLAGKVRGLQDYEFESNEAQQRFEELLEKLRQELIEKQFSDIAGAMSNMSPEDLARMKDMMAELNHMLEQRGAGEEPDFDGFMERYGDFFPENPQTLDQLLEAMAMRMAAAQAMLNSMTPEQRRQLQELSDALMEDLDLNFEANRLSQNLQGMFPDAGWQQSYDFSGYDPLGLADASAAFAELSQLDQMEQFLQNATNPTALADIDLDRVRELLGENEAASLERASQLAKMLEDQGLVQNKEGRLELTPQGLRRLGQVALNDLFSHLDKDALGQHDMDTSGIGHERSYDTRPYAYGDPFNLHIEKTIGNALRRGGGGVPIKLKPEDFEIELTERQVRSSTVIMLDLSMSMPMRGNFLPAKKVTLALHSLISSQFPRDYLGLVSFADTARELKPQDLPEVSWDYIYGTNMHHGFMLARQMLARQSGTKQIIMITDGEPTAHLTPDGYSVFNYPPTPECVEKTMAEVLRCTKAGITINTFMLDADLGLRHFVERLSEVNGGRAFFTSPDTLGEYLLVDFIEHKRTLLGRRSA